MHPHWQTIDETEQSVPVRIVKKAVPMISVPAATRSPAALVGIAIIALAGFFSFGGMDLLPAQVGVTAVTVTINDTGIVPIEIQVKPGQRINWVNASTIPHVLSSNTLKGTKGKPMETTAIFPGSDVSFDIPIDTPDGTYAYFSNMSKEINGRIVVQKGQQTEASSSSVTYLPYTKPSSSSTSSSSATPDRPVGKMYPSSQSLTSSVAAITASSQSMTTVEAGIIPQNPYTVGNTVAAPVAKNPADTSPLNTHRPTKQPESGMGLWIVSLIGLAALGLVMRRATTRM